MNFMLKNRNGSITIMLVAILIAALFLNNTFIEIGRYKAISDIYGEIQENAAFSVLANYDRDLFENYGLLAIDEDIDQDKFLQYLQADLTAVEGDKLDTYFNASDIQANLEKLYFLSQKDVFETQINEFCQYRAPITLASSALDIQEVLEKLIEELEDSLDFLDSFNAFAGVANKSLEAYDKLGDYQEQLEIYKTDIDNYQEAYDNYKEAVAEAENTWESLNAQEEARERSLSEEDAGDIPEVDWSPYYSACKSAANSAQNLKDKIDTVKQSTIDYWDKYSEFEEAFLAMQSANISATFEGAKLNKNSHDVAEEMQDSYDDAEDTTNKMVQMLKAYDYNYFNDLREQLDDDKEVLSGNQEKLNVQTKSKITVESVESRKYDLCLKDEMDMINNMIIESFVVAEQAIEENSAFINDMIELAEMYVDLQNSGLGAYNTKYTEDIGSVELVNLLNNPVENPYAENDKAHVDALVNDEKAQAAAAELGYRTAALGGDDRYAEFTQLEEALERFSQSAEGLNNAFKGLKESGLKLRQLIKSLLNIVKYVVEFLAAAINAVSLLLSCFTQQLQKVIYSKVFAATYATEMFTNRSSDVNSDNRMNGSSYTNYLGMSNGEVFVMANAEYVFRGSTSEIKNQECAFLAIMGLRLLANIPAVFKDKVVKSAVEAAAKIPYVGPVLAVLLFLAVLGIESYLDMIFMIYGDDGVFIVKDKLYLSAKGKDELSSQIKGILGNVYDALDDAPKKEKKKSLSDKLDDWSEGLFRWDYKQHLFLVLCLFVSSNDMYKREANLVQMQMDKEKLDKNFRLNKMATYVRTDTTVSYDPILPVPFAGGIPIRKMYYTGY